MHCSVTSQVFFFILRHGYQLQKSATKKVDSLAHLKKESVVPASLFRAEHLDVVKAPEFLALANSGSQS
jgi:hypothetical protein